MTRASCLAECGEATWSANAGRGSMTAEPLVLGPNNLSTADTNTRSIQLSIRLVERLMQGASSL